MIHVTEWRLPCWDHMTSGSLHFGNLPSDTFVLVIVHFYNDIGNQNSYGISKQTSKMS